MTLRYEIRQQVRTVQKTWLEVVSQPTSERTAMNEFEQLRDQYPGTYFEVVRIEVIEKCLGHTCKGVAAEC